MSSSSDIHISRIDGDSVTSMEDSVAVEEPLEIRLSSNTPSGAAAKSISITMRTPGSDVELALGFLFTEGIITDRDVSVYAIAMGHDPQTTEVQKVMTKQVYTCNAEQDISEAAKIMEQNKIRRLTVMNSEEDLAGFLSVDDLALVSGELAGAVLEAAIPTH